mmetsp:Transcript_7217/g.5479  ORF Transcript_7217/g.5479 Transcript_7217/m.5479 type:complete len:164 (+) Transcript_7217:1198-1689(+)
MNLIADSMEKVLSLHNHEVQHSLEQTSPHKHRSKEKEEHKHHDHGKHSHDHSKHSHDHGKHSHEHHSKEGHSHKGHSHEKLANKEENEKSNETHEHFDVKQEKLDISTLQGTTQAIIPPAAEEKEDLQSVNEGPLTQSVDLGSGWGDHKIELEEESWEQQEVA